MAELTIYPDAHPEVSCVDGAVAHRLDPTLGITWPSLIIAPGSYKNDVTSQTSIAYLVADSVDGRWRELWRAIYLFDTSGLPDGAIILSATFSVWGYQKFDSGGYLPSTNLYGSDPASDIALVPGDFARIGSTPYCDTPIAYGDWSTTGFNDFILNAAGLAAINRVGLTKLGIRNVNYDVAGVSPTWISGKAAGVRGVFAEQGAPYRPKLVITYTEVVAPTVTTDPATGRGMIVATIKGTLNQDGGEACECGFEWGPDIGYGVRTPAETKVTGETFRHRLLGLFPGTEYHYRAFATNSIGTSYGDDESFRSEPGFSRAYALAREEL